MGRLSDCLLAALDRCTIYWYTKLSRQVRVKMSFLASIKNDLVLHFRVQVLNKQFINVSYFSSKFTFNDFTFTFIVSYNPMTHAFTKVNSDSFHCSETPYSALYRKFVCKLPVKINAQ